MAQNLNQPDTVDGLPVSEIFSKARQSLDELLWNPDGYWNTFFVPTNRTETAEALQRTDAQDTFSDQLFGKWLSLIDPQAERVLPADKVNAALMMIYSNNLVDDPARGFRGWANGMRPGHQPEMKAGYHSRTCWFGPQEALASLLADAGEEEKSLDVFNSLESSLHNNHLFVGEWNKSVGPDGLSRTLPEEPNKDTPRFPPYPRYKSGWEYLRAILGLKMDAQNFYLNPFKSINFSLQDIELAGTSFTVTVESGWTKVLVDGKPQTSTVQVPRSHRAVKLEFIK
jgi:Glycosyl-hydrolase family 116, catalytic region